MHPQLREASLLADVGRHAEARQILSRVFAETPDDADAHLLAALMAHREDDDATANEHARAALAIRPGDRDASLMLVQVRIGQERWSEAEELLLPVIRRHPDDGLPLALYAHVMLCTLHLDKAAALIESARERDPRSRTVRLIHVLVATVRGERRVADEQLVDLVREDPKNRRIVFVLFAILADRNRHREALRVGQELLRAEPGNRNLVDALIEVRTLTHPVALPARPLIHGGWLVAGGMWLGAVVGFRLLSEVHPGAAIGLSGLFVVYVIYSWTYQPLLRRWIRWRGIR